MAPGAAGGGVDHHRSAQAGAPRRRTPRARRPPSARGGGRTDAAVLGREALDPPAVAVAHVAQPVVQSVVAVLPELVRLRAQAVAAPVLGPRDVAPFELARELGDGHVELRSVGEHAALFRRRRCELRAAWPRREVGIGLVLAHALDRPLDPHLPAKPRPVEEEGGLRVGLELAALAAAVPGEEDEALGAGAREQHHAHRRRSAGRRRRNRHPIVLAGLLVPAPELLERIGGYVVFAELAHVAEPKLLTCDLAVTKVAVMGSVTERSRVTEPAEEAVFRALADPTRRAILDRLFEHDGQSLGEIERDFDMSRFGVMKHLRVLEEAGLVTSHRVGRSKLHYLNPVPIQELQARWIHKFAAGATAALLGLRFEVEKGATMSATAVETPT